MAKSVFSLFRDRRIAAAVLAAAIYAVAQTVFVAHAATYGDAPHDHNGKPCVISVISKTADKAVDAAIVVLVASIVTWRASGGAPQTEKARIAIRAARSRGPPIV